MYKRVIMTDKKATAEAIAEAIELENISSVGRSGFIKGIDSDGDEIVITWCDGKCLSLPEPQQMDPRFEVWRMEDLPLPLFSENQLILRPDRKKQLYDIRDQLQDADDIVIASDAGSEGELSQRQILSYVLQGRQRLKKPNRMWLRSMSIIDMNEAYGQLLGVTREEDMSLARLYYSGRARILLDRYMTHNYSRLISLTGIDHGNVSYGRCESPLLHAIVSRDQEVEGSEPSFQNTVSLQLSAGSAPGITARLTGRNSLLETAGGSPEPIYHNLADCSTVIQVSRRKKCLTPPGPPDTLRIQKVMADKFSYEADDTLDILRRLFDTYKILTYPATDSRQYHSGMKQKLTGIVKALDFGEFHQAAEKSAGGFIPDKHFTRGTVTEHYALAPVLPEKQSLEEVYKELPKPEKNVYRQVLLSFLALFYPNHEYEEVEVITENNGHLFVSEETILLENGFKNILDGSTDKMHKADENGERECFLRDLKEGDMLKVMGKQLIDVPARQKKHFTTSSLLDYMKIHNIGTGATRGMMIRDLTRKRRGARDSLVRKDNGCYIATDFGKMVDSSIPAELKSIGFLRASERMIHDVFMGKRELKDVISDTERTFRDHMKMYADKR